MLRFMLELKTASLKLKNKKAPGPADVPSEVLKYAVKKQHDILFHEYSTLAHRETFPR